MALSQKFVFLVVMMQAGLNEHGKVRLPIKDWAKWGLSWEQVYATLTAMATHEIIDLYEEDNTYLIVVKNWDNYQLIF